MDLEISAATVAAACITTAIVAATVTAAVATAVTTINRLTQQHAAQQATTKTQRRGAAGPHARFPRWGLLLTVATAAVAAVTTTVTGPRRSIPTTTVAGSRAVSLLVTRSRSTVAVASLLLITHGLLGVAGALGRTLRIARL